MKEIDENLFYILRFTKISLKEICDRLKISRPNLYSGKISKNLTLLIRKEIESEIAKLYLNDELFYSYLNYCNENNLNKNDAKSLHKFLYGGE